MKTELLNGKNLLLDNGYTCLFLSDSQTLFSKERGVKPLLGFLENGKVQRGCSAIDKVVGKGAAMLYLLLGVKTLYALTISEPAYDVLIKNGVEVFFDNKVKNIINRLGDGLCPIEECVLDCDDPRVALDLIKRRLAT